jgi:membrane fusion protein (multidrug efflux system)
MALALQWPSARTMRKLVLATLLLFAGCQRQKSELQPAQRPPVEVGVVVLQEQAIVLTTELVGRTSAYETSEVRPQVSGIVRARLFEEGQQVKKGQTLYSIDASMYRAALAQARANVTSAEAAQEAASAKAERYAELVKEGVVSEQDFADARANARQSAAGIEQARAALKTASINLVYTEVPAPISGRIGRSLVTTGALVTANQAEPLATIQRLDPIYVDMQQSSADLLALRRSLAAGGSLPASADVQLKLEDGSDYGRVGQLQFSEVTVEPSTSTVTVRARFENPDNVLLPGMYVRALVPQARRPAAILAPQPGVLRDPKGNARAFIVNSDEQVVERTIRVTRVVEDRWLVEEGLAAGDRLIVEGTDKVKPGQKVRAVSVTSQAERERSPASSKG